eukprot:CAMPEP_0113942694 /NCGR_PEP_ID=MMETSP1339-20121228/8340_1 /TAXON_ID=94617 /ORGANISM="Fibrocapsa japonica" /LENGTH=642 /DNA_ID=CAMNT_0000947239 /DNA_START=65 /DNA_END=1993 /DNA_ORIENTATION=+ /assembly_acc=CAM_ASM_000762
MEGENKKAGLSANAPSFSFNPGASSWAPPPSAAAPAPVPVSISAAPAAPAPAPVSLPTSPPPPPPAAAPPAPEPEEDEIDENDPLWKATLSLASGDRAKAMKMLEDPDSLMKNPTIIAALGMEGGEGAGGEAAASWEDEAEEEASSAPPSAPAQAQAQAPQEEEEEQVVEDKKPPPAPPAAQNTESASPPPPAGSVVDADEREHLNIVFIGHVDAGKSTLSGNMLYLTGNVDARTIEKYEREAKDRNRESWWLAFIMDTNEEERSKGKTVEVGRAHFETEHKRYTILDAPGHKSYVPNMISGAAQADVGILVISARRGEFETGFERGGQTREHALLAKTLGVRYLVVVINKMDEPTVQWNKERFDTCVSKLKPYLRGCGFAPKKDVQFIPVSALTGANIKDPVSSELCPWWHDLVAEGANNTNATTLVDALDHLNVSMHRDATANLRIPVLDRYYDRGTVVLGKVEAGLATRGMKITVMPTGTVCKLDQIEINDEQVHSAKPGENVTVRLNIGMDDILQGFVLCAEGQVPCRAARRFTCQLALVELPESRHIYSAGYTCIMHAHTAAEECTCTMILTQVDKKAGKTIRRPRFAKQGAIITARMAVAQSICVEPFDEMPHLGRFTLRDQGITIAIGKVLSIEA